MEYCRVQLHQAVFHEVYFNAHQLKNNPRTTEHRQVRIRCPAMDNPSIQLWESPPGKISSSPNSTRITVNWSDAGFDLPLRKGSINIKIKMEVWETGLDHLDMFLDSTIVHASNIHSDSSTPTWFPLYDHQSSSALSVSFIAHNCETQQKRVVERVTDPTFRFQLPSQCIKWKKFADPQLIPRIFCAGNRNSIVTFLPEILHGHIRHHHALAPVKELTLCQLSCQYLFHCVQLLSRQRQEYRQQAHQLKQQKQQTRKLLIQRQHERQECAAEVLHLERMIHSFHDRLSLSESEFQSPCSELAKKYSSESEIPEPLVQRRGIPPSPSCSNSESVGSVSTIPTSLEPSVVSQTQEIAATCLQRVIRKYWVRSKLVVKQQQRAKEVIQNFLVRVHEKSCRPQEERTPDPMACIWLQVQQALANQGLSIQELVDSLRVYREAPSLSRMELRQAFMTLGIDLDRRTVREFIRYCKSTYLEEEQDEEEESVCYHLSLDELALIFDLPDDVRIESESKSESDPPRIPDLSSRVALIRKVRNDILDSLKCNIVSGDTALNVITSSCECFMQESLNASSSGLTRSELFTRLQEYIQRPLNVDVQSDMMLAMDRDDTGVISTTEFVAFFAQSQESPEQWEHQIIERLKVQSLRALIGAPSQPPRTMSGVLKWFMALDGSLATNTFCSDEKPETKKRIRSLSFSRAMHTLIESSTSCLQPVDIYHTIRSLDIDGDGWIELERFRNWMFPTRDIRKIKDDLVSNFKEHHQHTSVHQFFAACDTNHNKKIRREELCTGLTRFGAELKVEEISILCQSYGIDEDGCIDEHDFEKMFSSFLSLPRESDEIHAELNVDEREDQDQDELEQEDGQELNVDEQEDQDQDELEQEDGQELNVDEREDQDQDELEQGDGHQKLEAQETHHDADNGALNYNMHNGADEAEYSSSNFSDEDGEDFESESL